MRGLEARPIPATRGGGVDALTAALLECAFGFRGLLDAVLELLDDQRQVLGLGRRILRVLPLEARLEVAPDLPIGVAEMVVDDRIAGLEIDRLLELLHGFVVMAEAVMGPAEAVDDHAVARRYLDRALQHGEGLVDVD